MTRERTNDKKQFDKRKTFSFSFSKDFFVHSEFVSCNLFDSLLICDERSSSFWCNLLFNSSSCLQYHHKINIKKDGKKCKEFLEDFCIFIKLQKILHFHYSALIQTVMKFVFVLKLILIISRWYAIKFNSFRIHYLSYLLF